MDTEMYEVLMSQQTSTYREMTKMTNCPGQSRSQVICNFSTSRETIDMWWQLSLQKLIATSIASSLLAFKFIPHSELGYNAVKDTQCLKDDCLYFKLYLTIDWL